MTNRADLLAWQGRVATTRSARDLLDLLISPTDALERVRSLPAEDLYRAIRRIGFEDAGELLSLASGEQVRAMIDFDAWKGDTPEIERITPWLTALMHSGIEVLGERVLDLDDEMLNWLVRRAVDVHVVEDPDAFEAPDGEYVLTYDRRLLLTFPGEGEHVLPLKLFLDWLMKVQPQLCYDLLIFAQAGLDATLEEGAYRWRTARMADLGYVELYDALPIYTAPRRDQIAAARRDVGADRLPSTRWLMPVVDVEARIAAAVQQLPNEAQAQVQTGLTYLVNTALSADRVDLWDDDRIGEVLARVRAGLALGLDVLAGDVPEAERDGRLLATTSLQLVFRTGYARMLETVAPLRPLLRQKRLAGPGGPVDGVDLPALRPWAEALTARHPHLPGGAPPRSARDLAEMRQHAEILDDLVRVSGPERPYEVGIGATAFTRLTRDLLGLSGAEPLPLDLLGQAHRALFADGTVHPDALELARAAWPRLGGLRPPALDLLLTAAAEDLAHLDPAALDPRYISLWRVARP